MKKQQLKLTILLLIVLLALFSFAIMSTKAEDEEITVEKEGAKEEESVNQQATTPSNNNKQQAPASTKVQEELKGNNKNLAERNNDWLSNRRELKNLMKEMRKYQFGNDLFDDRDDWFGFNSLFPSRLFGSNSLFGNDNDDFFSNSFNRMKRRMNNMMKRSMLPSILDDYQWWDDWSNTINTARKIGSTDETKGLEQEKPLIEKKRREPITSVVKTNRGEDSNEVSLDINNIPRDIFDKKDIEIKVQENALGDMITIRGEKKTENGHYEFSKSYRFPKGSLDIDKVKASLTDSGTLHLSIPKIDVLPEKEKVKMISLE